jgi:hypothetical protein
MIGRRALLGAALLAAFMRCGPASAGECQGRIGPETTVSGRTAYDPFSPADVADDYRISVRNDGTEPCIFGLLFRSSDARHALSGRLAYDLTGGGGSSLLTSASFANAPMARLKTPIAPATTGVIEFQISIPRGQFAAPATYRDDIELQLYALDPSGRPNSSRALQTATLAISYTVPPVLSVNLKGGETATTLGFGTLVRGEQRSVAIEARSNQTYQLAVRSDNHGALALTPQLPGQNWSVRYSVALAGRQLDLSSAAALYNLPATRPESDASFPLTVTIGEVGQKRAGRYEDVINVEIQPAIP